MSINMIGTSDPRWRRAFRDAASDMVFDFRDITYNTRKFQNFDVIHVIRNS